MAGVAMKFARVMKLPLPAEDVFCWHERPGALDRLIPPWESVRVVRRTGGLTVGSEVELINWLGPVPLRWLARHTDYESGRRFCDEQIEGPFAEWRHEHLFTPLAAQ